MFSYILTGGFLKGYRTKMLAAISLAGLTVNYLVGDLALVDYLQQAWPVIAATFGMLAASVHETK